MSNDGTFELDIQDRQLATQPKGVVLDENELTKNTVHKNAKGGTELMLAGLRKRLDHDLWDRFNFIMSRVEDEFIDPDRPNILWLQDLPEDPASQHLADPKSRARFAKIVFNSYWQQFDYHQKLGVPYEEGVVLKNACESFPVHTKPAGRTNLIYFSAPHRGLHVLESAVRHLAQTRDDFVLDVYSSFAIYGWDEQDKQFQELYDRLGDLDCVNYHGSVSNDRIREALKTSHILAYPSTYVESSCCVAIEAMAAGLLTVVPNYGALTETCTDFAWMYNWESDPARHAQKFASVLSGAIDQHRDPVVQQLLKLQTTYYNYYFGWDMRVAQWDAMLRNLERK
jgi:glycosyltransferase involved in cell wall biosynthesis